MPATNTPNYFDATWAPAQPVDAIPNPAVDSAMGFSPQPGDSDGMIFAKGLQSSLFRNTKEGQDLTTSYAKQKLADQLTAQLEERKLQLRQQYPQYQFEKMPYGVVSMNPSTGEVKDAGGLSGDKNDPSTPAGLAFQTYTQEQIAAGKKAQYESSPDYYKNLSDEATNKAILTKNEADYYAGAKTSLAEAKAKEDAAIAQARLNPQAKPPTPQQALQAQNAAIASFYPGYDPKDTMGFSPGNKRFKADMQQDPQGTQDKINRKAQEILMQGRISPSGIASPNMGSGLLNLGNSPVFSPQPGMLDQ